MPRQGLNAPELTSPTLVAPSASRMSACCLGGAPPATSPTLRMETPSASCLLMTSPPRKSQASRRRFPIVHVRPASTGVMSSLRSLP